VKLEGLGQLKHPMTSSGIEPVTFWLVAQCLNQQCYCMPLLMRIVENKTEIQNLIKAGENKHKNVRFDILTMVTIKTVVFWDDTSLKCSRPCNTLYQAVIVHVPQYHVIAMFYQRVSHPLSEIYTQYT
jgi:hypothetical protein